MFSENRRRDSTSIDVETLLSDRRVSEAFEDVLPVEVGSYAIISTLKIEQWKLR
jgi:hypothetical protein